MKKSRVARFMGLAVAVAMTMAVMPVTASAAETPFVLETPGKSEALSIKEDYTANMDGEVTPSFLKGKILRIKENSTVTVSKSPTFDGEIECYGYMYSLNGENVITETSGQILNYVITDTPMQIELSEKPFGTGISANLKDVVYYIKFDCIPNDGGETLDYWIAYKVYNDDTKTPEKASSHVLTVDINKNKVLFEAFSIDNNNYISLRDFAMAVNGTAKQFEVGFDSAKNAITLTSNKAYTATGKELPINVEAIRREEEKKKYFEETGIRSDVNTALIDRVTKNAMPTDSKVYVDGKEVSLTAYNIGGSNYFKLRDVAKLFDIGVTFDDATSTVGIDTAIAYTE